MLSSMRPGKVYDTAKTYVCDCEFEKREFRGGSDVTNMQSRNEEASRGIPNWRGRIICSAGDYLPHEGFLRHGDAMHRFIIEDFQRDVVRFSG